MPPAGRPRTGPNRDLPPSLIRRERRGRARYYYQHPHGYQEPLGDELAAAIDRWREIRARPKDYTPDTFAAVADAFIEHGLKGLAIKTQAEYTLAIERLKRVFGAARMDAIDHLVVGKLMHELRDTPTQANRFKATLSRMWNWARSRGHTAAPNPCPDVEGYSEARRSIAVTPAMFWAIHDAGDRILRDWMRLDILIGQRVSDVLKVRRSDVLKEGRRRWLPVRATKTDTAGRIEIKGDLDELLAELLARKVTGPWLIQTDDGQPVTYAMLRNRFDAAREEVRKTAPHLADWQMRDLRKASLNQAPTLEEARRRAMHADPRTTARHYELVIEATAASLPPRPER